jgi:4-hydroxy-2-oxoglutarate aldolase
MQLNGIFAPITTPFSGSEVALDRLAANLARYEARGLAGYLVLGSTGEAALLTAEERLAVLRAARAAIARERTMIAGVGLESTDATVRLAAAACECGADALLVVTPSYFRAQMGEEALVRHFSAVADAAPRPVLLYNVPRFTGVVIPPTAVDRLARHPNVAGLKDSSGDLGWLLSVLARVPASFSVLCGSANVLQPALAMGAAGGILAVADVFPEPFVALYERQRAGHVDAALALQKALLPAVDLLAGRLGVAGIKAAMEERGLAGGMPRPPLLPLGDVDRAAVRECLTSLVTRGYLSDLQV